MIGLVQPGNAVFIDPSSAHYLNDKLFDVSDTVLNRDDTLLPYARLRGSLRRQGVEVRTADYLRRGEGAAALNHYWSIGLLNGYQEFVGRGDVRLRGFVLFEPPLVAPRMYGALPELTRLFDEVYVHNTAGDGYSLEGVDASRLRKLYWPQPYDRVAEPYWSRAGRLNKVVAISANHRPQFGRPELYGKRIEAMSALSRLDAVDLYGRGWDRWWSRQSMWLPYWRHRRKLMSIYKGPCASKLAVMSQYRFCLCLENMSMSGYITEKLFDCIYAGTIPIYWGATDIAEYVPGKAIIDARRFASWASMWDWASHLPGDEIQTMREAGRDFIASEKGQLYAHFLENVMAPQGGVG